MSLVDGHGPGVGFEAVVELPRARDLFVDEGGRARSARAPLALVVHLVQAEPLAETL